MEVAKYFLTVTLLVCYAADVYGEFKAEDCEACVYFLKALEEEMSDETHNNAGKIDGYIKEFCQKTKVREFHRICYYVGGLEDSATSIRKEVSLPMSYHKPIVRICEALNKKDAQICEVRIKKKINLAEVDLKKLRVKQLKEILSDWERSDACKGCAEKSDFIRAVEELMPKYDPAAYKIRKQKEEL